MNPLRANPRLLGPILAGLAMIGPFSVDTFFPAFHKIEGDLGVSAETMQLSISVYLIGYAVMSLMHGPLSDTFGRRGVILVMMTIYAASSSGAALTRSFNGLLFFRLCQGGSVGAATIVGRAIIRDRFSGPDAQRLMAQVSMIFAVAPALAPIIGGWLFDIAGWRSIFWAVCAYGILLVVASIIILPETHPRSLRVPLSVKGLIATYTAVLKDRRYMCLAAMTSFMMGAFFLYIASAPVIVLDHLGLNERQFWWLFVPMISGMTLGSMLSGRLAGRLNSHRTIGLAYILMFVGIAANLLVSHFFPPSKYYSLLPMALYAVGMGVSMPSLNLMMLDRFPMVRGAAASLQSACMLAFNALISAWLSPLFSHNLERLAIGSASMTLCGFGCWTWYRRAA